jgi:hypothetical protein
MIRGFPLLCVSLVFITGCGRNQTSTRSEAPMTSTTRIQSARMLPVLLKGGDGGGTQQVELVIE